MRDQRRGPLHSSLRRSAPAAHAQYDTEVLCAERAAQPTGPQRRRAPAARWLRRYLPTCLPGAQCADGPYVSLYRPRPQRLTLPGDVSRPAATDELSEEHQRLEVVCRTPGIGGVREGLALRGFREVAEPG
eukprot:4980834-Pleurochrysis_carterae.AAC.1